jgi:hypothetical protein
MELLLDPGGFIHVWSTWTKLLKDPVGHGPKWFFWGVKKSNWPLFLFSAWTTWKHFDCRFGLPDYPFSSGKRWWLSHPSEKYEFVNGKDDIPYNMEK